TRDVGGGEHLDHARRLPHRIEVEARDAAGGDRRVAGHGVEEACRLANVVGIDGGAGDVLDGAVMRQWLADDRQRLLAVAGLAIGHQATSRRPISRVRVEAVPAASISALPSRAWAVS